jgi:hypothetical protein
VAAPHDETMTAADLAATVRDALDRWTQGYHVQIADMPKIAQARAALDALQAQAEAAEAAQREADIQMGEKLAAQMTLKAVCDVLNLPMVSLGNGWTEATPKILARIEEILDEADRGFRERDAVETYNARLRETLARVRPDIDPETGYGRQEAI